MPAVKISGITNSEDAKWAAILGVEYVSLTLKSSSDKNVSLDKAIEISKMLPSYTSIIVETGLDNINVKKIEKISPSFIQIKLTQAEACDYYKLNLKIPIILEVSLSDVEIDYDGLNIQIFHLKLSENFNKDELELLKEKFNTEYPLLMEKTIVEGDWKLDEIKSACEILHPLAWSVREVIEKSPRKIDYSKMKKYIREISLW